MALAHELLREHHARRRIPASGIHWRPGIIVAAHHTIQRDEDITVTIADGTSIPASLVGRDPTTDLAVLRADGITAPVARLADASGVRVGALVLALGRPGPAITASLGVISAVGGEWRTWHGGTIDRFVINAGLGKSAPLGTGKFYANRQTSETNFIGALAQTEAAAEILREQNFGHFVMVSSVSAMRGLPGNVTAYAATKAGVAHLAEGLRADLLGTPIKVTVLYPGYIVSEMSGTSARTPLMTSTEKGVRAMVEAIEKEKKSARVPAWPWAPLGVVVKRAPVGLLRRMS